jgi:hypothetical protein
MSNKLELAREALYDFVGRDFAHLEPKEALAAWYEAIKTQGAPSFWRVKSASGRNVYFTDENPIPHNMEFGGTVMPLYTSAQTIPEEENQAVRMFLLYYGGNTGCTIGGMVEHLKCAGFDECWPDWVDAEDGHLTKAGAQHWIRHLLLSTAPEQGEPK